MHLIDTPTYINEHIRVYEPVTKHQIVYMAGSLSREGIIK